MRTLGSIVATALLVSSCGGDDAPTFSDVADTCDLSAGGDYEAITIETSSDSITVVSSPRRMDTTKRVEAMLSVNCVSDLLGGPPDLPDLVYSSMGMSGARSASWRGFRATWTYPGTELRFTIETD